MNDNAKMGVFALCGAIGGAVLAWTIRSIRAKKEVEEVIDACEASLRASNRVVDMANTAAENATDKASRLREQLEHDALLRNELEDRLRAAEADREKDISLARAEGYLEGERDAKAAAKPPKPERPPRPRPQPRSATKEVE